MQQEEKLWLSLVIQESSGPLLLSIVVLTFEGERCVPALIEAVNAEQLPAPVRKEKKHIDATL